MVMALAGALAPTAGCRVLQISSSASSLPACSSGHKLGNSRSLGIGAQVNLGLGSSRRVHVVRAMAEKGTAGSRVEEKLGVRIERGPSDARLQELGIRSWPKWGCPASKFPWSYDGKETCYLLKGKVKVYPEGSSDFVEFGAGDLVVFPKGMNCTWEVSEAVDKHYQFEY